MLIFIRLNGTLAQSVGASRIQLTLPQAATIQEMLNILETRYPQAAKQIHLAIPVVNGIHQAKSIHLAPQQEVALLMPVAGGSGRL